MDKGIINTFELNSYILVTPTPIQELINELTEFMRMIDKISEDSYYKSGGIAAMNKAINICKSKLPTERQFAETFYDKGRKYGNNYDDRNAFDNEFKKYTHD